MFLEGYSVFAQIGVGFCIPVASLAACVVVQASKVLYYLLLPIGFFFRMCCKCECRDKNGKPIEPMETTADWDDYAFRCPCVGDDEDEAFKV